MKVEGRNDGSDYQTLVVKDTVLVKYNGGAEFVRLPGFIYIVGKGAFADNDIIKAISLSSNMKEIGDFAFKNCKSLSELIFSGTKEHWIQINKGEKLYEGTGNFVIRCKNGEITKQEEIECDPKLDSEIAEMLAKLRVEGKAARIKLKEIEDKKEKERQEYQAMFEGNRMSDDELCRKALKFFIAKGSATVLTVASEFKIDYVRARILIYWMESNGYIKAMVEDLSFAPYEVLITSEEFKKIFGSADGGA